MSGLEGRAIDGLVERFADADVAVHQVGDYWAPRSLDEAVWEGFETATRL